ncbi:MAG: glycosyltransferase family 2 protein [Methylomonas sp.]|nr:glycosyltransferase family 2 protein [Methylomonas sp.]PPD22107.1 MAG: glycosyltransferase [Methylomonas sp.]PPD42406.1 MAG: glycosyltransferase [Methylomonas sp.]PPD53116.1 MAG: glycosyltransferase [Methylomonas sp.]
MKLSFSGKIITFAFCTFNRANRLEKLVSAIRHQIHPWPFEILAINNNSQDNTLDVLAALSKLPGAPLRFVTETKQGIVAARNRAIEESIGSDILIFIDDDEVPLPGLIAGACDAILNDGADCVGGRVRVDFSQYKRPAWLGDDLLGFLAEVDYGDYPFWITTSKTPVWTANIAYDMTIFRHDPSLRFDKRYDRKGKSVGGGEDLAMFNLLLKEQFKIRYSPNMIVLHSVEDWKLSRRYFIKLHFKSGEVFGRNEMPRYSNTLLGYPRFLISQLLKHFAKALIITFKNNPGKIRQYMNVAHALGCLAGYKSKNKTL